MIQQEQVISYTDLKPGKIYNREYIGDNEAYKKCNGKTTFKVVSFTKEKLVIRELFASGGYVFDQYLIGNEITFYVPENIGKEYVIYECSDISKWFIHNQVMDLQTAINNGVITLDTIKIVFRDKSKDYIRKDPIVHYEGGKKALELSGNPTVEFPYLTSVAFVFDSWNDTKEKIRKVYPEAWFMD